MRKRKTQPKNTPPQDSANPTEPWQAWENPEESEGSLGERELSSMDEMFDYFADLAAAKLAQSDCEVDDQLQSLGEWEQEYAESQAGVGAGGATSWSEWSGESGNPFASSAVGDGERGCDPESPAVARWGAQVACEVENETQRLTGSARKADNEAQRSARVQASEQELNATPSKSPILEYLGQAYLDQLPFLGVSSEVVAQQLVELEQAQTSLTLPALIQGEFQLDWSGLVDYLQEHLSVNALAYWSLTPLERELVLEIVDYHDPQQYDQDNRMINYLYFVNLRLLDLLREIHEAETATT